MKRNSILLLLMILVTGSTFVGCKKGAQDPFFSFRSRKARVAGSYNITALAESFKQVYAQADNKAPEQHELTIAGTSQTETIKYLGLTSKLGGDSILTNGFPTKSVWKATGTVLTYTMDFDKKGPFTGVYEYKIVATKSMPDTIPAYTRTVTITHKESFRGTWDFLTGVDNFKKKQRIALIYEDTQVTETYVSTLKFEDETVPSVDDETSLNSYGIKYANGENSEVYEITELRSKKMVFYRKIEDYQTSNGNFVSSRSGDRTITLEEAAKK